MRPRRALALLGLALLASISFAEAKKRKRAEPATPAGIHDVALRGDTAWVARRGGLLALDISDPSLVRQNGELALAGTIADLVLEGDTALLAAGAVSYTHLTLPTN